MNPNWNQQQGYNYHQHSSGPPPPPWQSDPHQQTGWRDPRLQHVQQPPYNLPTSPFDPNSFNYTSSQPAKLPPPPPPPPPPSIHYPPPPEHGAPHGPPSQPQNTAQWGVRYNQVQNQSYNPQLHSSFDEQRPALPPRPNSTFAQNPQAPPPVQTWQRPTAPSQQAAVDPWDLSPAHGPPDLPPIPPPRPQAYMRQTPPPQDILPHAQYSHQPPTHHYDPAVNRNDWHTTVAQQHQPPSISTHAHTPSEWTQYSHTADGTVSPLEEETRRDSLTNRSHTVSPVPHHEYRASRPPHFSHVQPSYPDVQIGATALGPGQPSDWQHYQASYSYEGNQPSYPQQPAGANQYGQFVASPDKIHKLPVADHAERIQPPPEDTIPFRPQSRAQAYTSSEVVEADHPLGIPVNVVHNSQLPRSKRTGSSSIASSSGGPQRTGTIDSVIHAWSTPLKKHSMARDAPVDHSDSSTPSRFASDHTDAGRTTRQVETIDSQSQTDFPPVVNTETKVVTQEIEVNPYEDIQDLYKATLNRFAGMLRQEAVAENEEEKFKIFQGFVIRELRLRSVLYGIEAQHVDTIERSVQSDKTQQSKEHSPVTSSLAVADEDKVVSYTVRPQTPQNHLLLATDGTTTPSTKDDSFVVVNAHVDEDEDEYSPGGRPRTIRKHKPQGLDVPTHFQTNSLATTQGVIPVEPLISPGANAPITLEDYEMPDQQSPSNDAPILVTSEEIPDRHPHLPRVAATLSGPIDFQPSRPVYTPFRYAESASQSPPDVLNDRSVDNYADLRQVQAAESGRMLINDLPPSLTDNARYNHTKDSSISKREHEEAFIGLIRQQSKAIRKPLGTSDNPPQLRAGTPLKRNAQTPVNVSPLTKSIQSLRACVSQSTNAHSSDSSHPKLDSVKRELAVIRDDFGFIHATVLAWDMTNRKIRQQLETERTARQSDNEARVDELFHDNEIGYADIGSLESDFKLEEASKKYHEDKLELESFSKDVFKVVVERMEGELAELSRLQTLTRDLLDLNSQSKGGLIQSTVAEKQGMAEKVLMTDVMDLMLQVFSKIEVRYLKIAEAHFELERRRKKLELSILYVNGDNNGVKLIEKDFAKAQTMQILDEARKKDERANKLIDSFDRAVVRGLAENQAWIDDVLPKLQLLRDLLFGSEENYPQEQSEQDDLIYGDKGVKDINTQAQTAIDLLIADSQLLLKLSYSADQILNEADFGMYLANEKIAKSDANKFEKLKHDKQKEDEKIREEFEARLNVVRGEPREIVDLIREINGRIGNDKEHKARIEQALDEAKRRNQVVEGLT